MELVLTLPDQIAKHLAGDADVSRIALEAIALEGFRSRRLTSFEVSQLLGFSRIETQNFLGANDVSLCDYDEGDLDREAAVWDRVTKSAASR
jgi:predicted HTH domain antitoxin